MSGMDVHVNEDGSKATVKMPGFTVHDFDRTGHLSICSIQKTLTAARFLAYHIADDVTGRTFLEYDKLTSDRLTFMASTETSVDRKLHELTRQSLQRSKEEPFSVVIQLGYVGRSSLSSVAQLVGDRTGDVLVTNTNQVVSVDKQTRKPTPLSDWWKDKYSKYTTQSQPLVIPLINTPENTHDYSMKVPWTDIDNYKHTNYVSYIRYCYDAALDATFSDFYSKVKGDFLQYKVKDLKISYKGESVANEELLVRTWENDCDPYLIHFSIERQGQVLFQNTIELFKD